MNITINGELKTIETNPSLTTLDMVISQLGHHPQSIVVELNGIIVNRKKWLEHEVEDGDKVEIVTIVGGG